MTYPLPATAPLLGPTISGTQITVDTMTKPATRIAPIIRDLVAQNEGYYAEEIFATPGFTVDGGALIYSETFPADHFLDPDQSLAPRAPGAEAPLIGALRPTEKIARPESLSGTIEVYDEQRRRNDVAAVQALFRKTANTFADRMQTKAIRTLNAAITAWGRTTSTVSWADAAAASGGVVNVAQNTLPGATFGQVLKQFVDDRAGVRPDTAILSSTDALNLRMIVGPQNLQAFLESFGIRRLRETPELTAGTGIFLKSRQVGVIAFEKPLDTEQQREAKRKTDVYVVEATPVFVAVDASAVLQVTGLNA
jgi:hypothetical protein